jgi:hypothetical protein
MVDSLDEYFQMRCTVLCSLATNTRISENPVAVEVSDAAEKLQPELTELQHDSVLPVYQSLGNIGNTEYPSVLGSTCTREQAFFYV